MKKNIIKQAMAKGAEAVSFIKSEFKRGGIKAALAAALAILSMNAVPAQAAIDTTNMDIVLADAQAWVNYGVAAAIGMLGLGLAYVGGRWAYKKIKGGISAA